ncbi:hypothetical protein Tco_1180444 [Tanacetum coccineum]
MLGKASIYSDARKNLEPEEEHPIPSIPSIHSKPVLNPPILSLGSFFHVSQPITFFRIASVALEVSEVKARERDK